MTGEYFPDKAAEYIGPSSLEISPLKRPSSSFHRGDALIDASSDRALNGMKVDVAHPDEDGVKVSSKLGRLSADDLSARIDGGIGRVGGGFRDFSVKGMVCCRAGGGRAAGSCEIAVAGAECGVMGLLSFKFPDVIPERSAWLHEDKSVLSEV